MGRGFGGGGGETKTCFLTCVGPLPLDPSLPLPLPERPPRTAQNFVKPKRTIWVLRGHTPGPQFREKTSRREKKRR